MARLALDAREYKRGGNPKNPGEFSSGSGGGASASSSERPIKGYSRAGSAATHSSERLKHSLSKMLPKGIQAEIVPKVVTTPHG
jgi:hypothetical protein